MCTCVCGCVRVCVRTYVCRGRKDLIGAWAYSRKNDDLPAQSRHCPETRQSCVSYLTYRQGYRDIGGKKLASYL